MKIQSGIKQDILELLLFESMKIQLFIKYAY
jgi:hypothetical protein